MFTLRFPLFGIALGSLFATAPLPAAEEKLTIRSDYPGGNVLVEGIEGLTARVAPDLRTTTMDWFYWDFTAEAAEPGRARFVFTGPRIGTRGPAVSLDGGRTWKWLGTENVTYSKGKENPEESFEFDFSQAGQKVRFAVGFPYVQSHLEEFLKKNAGNPNLTTGVLTKSGKDRPVELLQIGQPGPNLTAVLAVARSHACEALASYVLEGFLDEALSDSPAGVEFRKKYVLYTVPFLDKDGVEEGDQGKNRAPHDHNRDYGSTQIYPEIKALQDLAADNGVRIAFDFHCPYLRGDVHEAYHWLGLRVPHVADNIGELNSWLAEERPLSANTAISFLKKPEEAQATENIPFSWYFARQPGNLIGVTLESPYAQAEDVESARDYGRGLLRALVRTEMVGPEPGGARGTGAHASFEEFRKTMAALAGKPDETLYAANEHLENPAAPPHYRAQAHLAMAALRQRERNFSEALTFARAAKTEPGATASQKASARVLTATILGSDAETSPAAMEEAVRDIETFSFASPAQRATVYKQAADFYEKQGDLEKTLAYLKKRVTTCPEWEKGGALLQEARILDEMNRGSEAVERRKEVVTLLRPQVLPAPKGKSVLLGVMTGDFFDAVVSLPDSTREEKREAAQVVLNFPTLPVGLKERVQKWVSENTE